MDTLDSAQLKKFMAKLVALGTPLPSPKTRSSARLRPSLRTTSKDKTMAMPHVHGLPEETCPSRPQEAPLPSVSVPFYRLSLTSSHRQYQFECFTHTRHAYHAAVAWWAVARARARPLLVSLDAAHHWAQAKPPTGC